MRMRSCTTTAAAPRCANSPTGPSFTAARCGPTTAGAWDVEDFDVSSDGRYVAYVVDDDGRSRLTVLDTQAKLELAPVGLPEGRIGNLRFDRSGRRLAMSAESAVAPRDVYVYEVEHGKLERWAASAPGPRHP